MSYMGVVAKRRARGEVQQLRMQRRLGLLARQGETPLGRIALAFYVEAGTGQHHGAHAHFVACQCAGLVGQMTETAPSVSTAGRLRTMA
jgi:hypothetical protein